MQKSCDYMSIVEIPPVFQPLLNNKIFKGLPQKAFLYYTEDVLEQVLEHQYSVATGCKPCMDGFHPSTPDFKDFSKYTASNGLVFYVFMPTGLPPEDEGKQGITLVEFQGKVVVLYAKMGLSNFCEITLDLPTGIIYKCTEQLFKVSAASKMLLSKESEHYQALRERYPAVMLAVHQALKPSEAKRATDLFPRTAFDSKGWNAVSQERMLACQFLRLQDPEQFAEFKRYVD